MQLAPDEWEREFKQETVQTSNIQILLVQFANRAGLNAWFCKEHKIEVFQSNHKMHTCHEQWIAREIQLCLECFLCSIYRQACLPLHGPFIVYFLFWMKQSIGETPRICLSKISKSLHY